VIDEAGDLTAVVDACGKAGRGDIGASLCLRSSHALQEAREITALYRQSVIAGVREARRLDERVGLYEVDDENVASDVADVLAYDLVQDGPVFVIGRGSGRCSISARCPPGVDLDLDALMRTVARACGGHGGGHRQRAGARIPAGGLDRFREELLEAILP
jgi:single-stranded DNA-specific DHH superfamily exonuclease